MNKIVYYAKNTAELLYQLKTNKGLEVVGGLTKVETQPEKAISVHGISDLCQIVKHERYIDIGPGATLSDILAMGKNHIPQVLYDALDCIANPIVRKRRYDLERNRAKAQAQHARRHLHARLQYLSAHSAHRAHRRALQEIEALLYRGCGAKRGNLRYLHHARRDLHSLRARTQGTLRTARKRLCGFRG